MNRYVFVYGTLKRGGHNHSVLGHSKFISDGVTEELFTMYDGPFPIVTDEVREGYSGHVEGEIYLVDDEEVWKALDILEGVPYLYIRKDVKVDADWRYDETDSYTCVMYVASNNTEDNMMDKIPMVPNSVGELSW